MLAILFQQKHLGYGQADDINLDTNRVTKLETSAKETGLQNDVKKNAKMNPVKNIKTHTTDVTIGNNTEYDKE